MELWIPITLFAALSQTVRTAMQKHLKGRLGTTGATFVRFGYGFPFAILYVAFLHWGIGDPFPTSNVTMWVAGAFGGIAQIIATFLLVHLFSYRNFAVGTAYSKTEPIQAALFGLVFLGEHVTSGVAVAIVVGVTGVVLISIARTKLTLESIGASLLSRPALIGLASAAFFGASAAAYRLASLSLDGTSVPMQAGYTLACVTVFQTLVMAGWMIWREPDQLSASIRNWRVASWVGLSGVAGSAGWFTAMTLEPVAHVRGLAQVELIFTFAVSWFVFHERLSRIELVGCCLVVFAVLGIILQA